MVSSTTTATRSPPSDDVLSERHLRKRLAARVRQQRCRARKREAKLAVAKVQHDVKAPRPSMVHHHQVVRGPVLIRSPPRMSMPLLHHPTSPFMMYPRQAPSFPPHPSSAGSLWLAQPRSPPMTSRPITRIPFHATSNRPLHHEIMTGSAMALGICRTPPTSHHVRSPLPNLHIPRVSPVAESCSRMVPIMPELDRLERKEETAIDAMLSLGRRPSQPAHSSPLVRVGNKY